MQLLRWWTFQQQAELHSFHVYTHYALASILGLGDYSCMMRKKRRLALLYDVLMSCTYTPILSQHISQRMAILWCVVIIIQQTTEVWVKNSRTLATRPKGPTHVGCVEATYRGLFLASKDFFGAFFLASKEQTRKNFQDSQLTKNRKVGHTLFISLLRRA